jgi:hypothetical protein
MKSFVALLLAVAALPALAQPPGQGTMPPPERRMSWEERQRLREEVRSGNMSRDEARQRWREQREQRGVEHGRSREERQRMRRDVMDANRDLQKR